MQRTARICVWEGAVESEPGRLCVEGICSPVKTLLPQATIVASFYADWDPLKAMTSPTDLLKRSETIDTVHAIIGDNGAGKSKASELREQPIVR